MHLKISNILLSLGRVFCMSVRSSWVTVLFKSSTPLFISMVVLSTIESGC